MHGNQPTLSAVPPNWFFLMDATTVLNEFLDSLGIRSDPDHPIQWNLDTDTFHNDQLLANHTEYYEQGTPESPQHPTNIQSAFGNRAY